MLINDAVAQYKAKCSFDCISCNTYTVALVVWRSSLHVTAAHKNRNEIISEFVVNSAFKTKRFSHEYNVMQFNTG